MMRRVVILEPDLDGHHAFWLALLIEAHRQAGWGVEVVTANDYSRLRAQAALRGFELSDVQIHAVSEATDSELLKQARALAKQVGADRVFVAFLDRFWPALLKQSRDWGQAVKVAGIWFHPHALDTKWRWAPPVGKRWKLRGRVNRFVRSSEARRMLDGVYFLLGEAKARLHRLAPTLRAHVLSDPFEREPYLSKEEARRVLGLPLDRMIFLHLGSAERRKGLPDTLEVFGRLNAAPDTAWPRLPLLLRVGSNDRLSAAERSQLDELIGQGWASSVESFVPAAELMEYFAACDWVLIPYRKFRYSSGILANAIGARRPVVAYDYGEVGRAVGTEGLGLICRHGSKKALLNAVRAACGLNSVHLADRSFRGRTVNDFIAMLEATLRKE